MAARTVLRQLRFKTPLRAQRFSGDCLKGLLGDQAGDCLKGLVQCGNRRSSLLKRAVPSNSHGFNPGNILSADRSFWHRGYSSEASLTEACNCVSQDSPSRSTTECFTSSNGDTTQEASIGPKVSKRHNLAMIFTCTVCETRSAKTMSRETYEKGVVIVRCGGCKNLHLIADRLGWFGEPGSVEDFLKHKGVEVRKGSEESYEFTVEDLAGWSPPGKE